MHSRSGGGESESPGLLNRRLARPPSRLLPFLLFCAFCSSTAWGAFVDESSLRLPSGAADSYAIAVGDVDANGTQDLVIAIGGQTRLFLNDGSGVFTDATGRLPQINARALGLALADVNGDLSPDLILANASGPNLLLINDGLGNFVDDSALRLPAPAQGGISTDTVLVDVDQDGALDLVVAKRGSANRLLLNDGSGVYRDAPAGSLPAVVDRTQAIALADVNGDGATDIFFANDGGQNRLYRGNGLGVFTDVTASSLPVAADESLDAAFGDVDADGDPDLLIANGAGGLKLLLNEAGSFVPAGPLALPVQTDYAIAVALGDVDFDGSTDVVVANAGQDRVLLNDGTGLFQDATNSQLPVDDGRSFGLALADLDADFDLDMVVAVPQGGNRLLVNRHEAPRIRITVSPRFIEVGDTVTIAVQVFDEDGVASTSLAVNGTPVALDAQGNGTYVPDIDGLHTAVITSQDTLGNVGTRSVTFVVAPPDLSAPVVSLSIITPPPILVGQPVTIQATALDTGSGVAGLVVTVNGQPLLLDTTGTGVFVPGTSGLRTVTATATDFAGNVGTATDTFDVQPDLTAPVVTLSASPNPVDIANPISIGVGATDDVAVTSLTLAISGPGITGQQELSIGAGGQATFKPYLPGTYTLTARALDAGGNEGLASLAVTAVGEPDVTPPSVTVQVVPGNVAIGGSVTITVTATDDVLVTSVSLEINGTPVALDASGRVVFTPPVIGPYTAVGTALDPTGNEGTALRMFSAVDPSSDTSPPYVALSSPDEGATLTSLTDIIGTADDLTLTQYTLSIAPAGSPSFIPIATGTTNVQNGVLGTLDPTLLENGVYRIRLSASDVNGLTSFVERDYPIDGQQKVGNYTVTFVDLTVPLAGIPITIERTYDSRTKDRKDFGIGWTLSVKQGAYTNNREPGEGWQILPASDFLHTPCSISSETKYHVTGIRLSHAEFYRFALRVNMYGFGSAITGACIGDAEFVQVDGPPGATLGIVGDTEVVWLNGGNELTFGLGDPRFGDTWEPDDVRLTTADGRVFDFDLAAGLTRLEDANGNSLSITPGSIVHSSGSAVIFTRDAQGRIGSIVDPNGNDYRYEYDAAGDLVAFTDPEDARSTYTYDSRHNLLDFFDARGNRAARNEYDDAGRLIATVDGQGNRIDFDHDVEGRREVVRDRLGNATIFEYDESGNIISETDALGNTTRSTYDSDGNRTSVTLPTGETTTFSYDSAGNQLTQTDALGNVTRYSYDSRGNPLTLQDALGGIVSNTYDANGNLLTTADPLGNTARHAYDSAGNAVSTTDALGNVVLRSYDARGRVTQETDPLGRVTTYTYDANGNRLTETRTRTNSSGAVVSMTTSSTYDAKGRLVETTDPLGHVERTEYNVLGKVSAKVDRNGNRTEFEYDALGNLIRTTYEDGTFETSAFDAEGNKVSATNRRGLTTRFAYDALKRLVRTTHPDDSVATREYDARGNLTREVDENGNATRFEYDAVGRRTRTIDATGHAKAATYDAVGRPLTSIDELGRTTTFQYDALGRRTRTTSATGSFTSAGYDALGRKVSETDAAGRTTTLQYDALHRLTAVVDALGQRTSFTYDEVGNKITQVDASGRTTRWAYDDLGRVLSKTLPLGMTESFTYDGNGNVLTHTDFAGFTTRYVYDSNDRLVLKTFPDASGVTYTYLAAGEIATVTDLRGVTRSSHDARGRLTRVEQPDGSTLEYTYDAAGNRATMTSSSGMETHAYDALNRLIRVTAPDGGVTSYAYDAAGNRTSLVNPNGVVTTYAYDALNRMVSLSNRDPGGAVLSSYAYTLGAAGNRLRVEEAGTATAGRTVDYVYDDLYRLVEERIDKPGTTDDRSIAYTYDAVGNRLSRVVTAGSLTATTLYTYDGNDRLLAESTTSVIAGALPGSEKDMLLASTPPASVSGPPEYGTALYLVLFLAALLFGLGEATYRLARAQGRRARWLRLGNAATRSLSLLLIVSIAFQPNLARALAVGAYPGERPVSAAPGEAVPAETITYTYDANGNTLTRSNGTSSDSYSYDFEHRLVGAVVQTGPAPGVVSYAYDSDGIRVSKTTGGVTTHYLVDKNRPHAQVVLERSGAQTVSYLHGDGLIRRTDSAGSAYYLYDGNLSTRQLTDAFATVTDTYTYDAFGVPLAVTGSTPNDYLYAGEQFDANVGFYYLRARYYSPAVGRFLTTDPFEGNIFEPVTLHKYVYAGNDPSNKIDPGGEQFLSIAIPFPTISFALPAISLSTILGIGAIALVLAIAAKTHPIRLNHYTDWAVLPFIFSLGPSGGINNPTPGGENFFTPGFYFSSQTAKSKLALSRFPEVGINLTVFLRGDGPWRQGPVGPKNSELGGGYEFVTAQPIRGVIFRGPIMWPLF